VGVNLAYQGVNSNILTAHWMVRAWTFMESESVHSDVTSLSSVFLFLCTLYISTQSPKIIVSVRKSKTPRKTETSRWFWTKLRRSCRPIPLPFSGLSSFAFHFCSVNLNDAESIVFLTVVSDSVCSKTYCPFCDQVKHLFSSLGVTYKLLELDVECVCLFLSYLFAKPFYLCSWDKKKNNIRTACAT